MDSTANHSSMSMADRSSESPAANEAPSRMMLKAGAVNEAEEATDMMQQSLVEPPSVETIENGEKLFRSLDNGAKADGPDTSSNGSDAIVEGASVGSAGDSIGMLSVEPSEQSGEPQFVETANMEQVLELTSPNDQYSVQITDLSVRVIAVEDQSIIFESNPKASIPVNFSWSEDSRVL